MSKLVPEETRSHEQKNKSKASRNKEIISTNEELDDRKMKKAVQKMSKTERQFLEKMNNTDKSLATVLGKEELIISGKSDMYHYKFHRNKHNRVL